MKILQSATLALAASLGVALVTGAAGAQAQTVISRQVDNGLVETTVTRTPTSTVITRRALGPGVAVAPRYVPPRYAPATETTYVRETVGVAPAERTFVERRADEFRTTTRSRHSGATHRVVRSRTMTRIARAAPPLVLDTAQCGIVYRTIVEQHVLPSASAYPAFPPPAYPRRTVMVTPAETTGYGVSTPVMDDDVFVEQLPATAASYPATYPVGSVLPASVVVTPLPATAALAVPAVQPYSYATIDGRVLLIDPDTNTVVADITP